MGKAQTGELCCHVTALVVFLLCLYYHMLFPHSPISFLSFTGSSVHFITKTHPFNIMALFMAAKTKSFRWKNVIVLLFLLETEIVGKANGYPQSMFYNRNITRKIIYTPANPIFFCIKVGFEEVKITNTITVSKMTHRFDMSLTISLPGKNFDRLNFDFYTPPHDSGGVLWFHVGRLCVCPSQHLG